jgi:hypothetical protein
MGIYGGDYDNDDNSDLSYHSSNGSDKDDSDVNLSLGNGAEGTSPTATKRNTAEQTPLRRQMDDIPDWLQEMIDNQEHTGYLTFFPHRSPNAPPALHATTTSM